MKYSHCSSHSGGEGSKSCTGAIYRTRRIPMKTRIQSSMVLSILAGLFLNSGICFGQVKYNFSTEKPLNYDFKIDGTISYQYEGVPAQEFSVLSKGRIRIDTIEKVGEICAMKLTPSRTFVKLNDMVLEDFTGSETARSQVISAAMMEIRENGEVVSATEISPGILNLSQMLMMIPDFPARLRSGTRWQKTIPAFSLPGVPMCALRFTYVYNPAEEGSSRIELLSNQSIREQKRDGDVSVSFTGRNSSKGEFLFDENEGELTSFSGVIDLILSVVFKVPPGPDQKPSTKQSLPLRMNIKLNVSLSEIAG